MTASSTRSPSETCDDDRALLDLLRALGDESDRDAMYAALDRALSRVVPYDRIAIGWLNRTTRRITNEYERGVSIGLPERYESLPTDRRSLTFAVINDGHPVIHTVPERVDVYRGDAIRRRYGLRQVLVAPIVIRGVTSGVVKLYARQPNQYTSRTAGIAERFSRALGLALASVRANPDGAAATERLIAEVTAGMCHADSTEALFEELYRGIVGTTGAAILRFDRRGDDRYEYAGARNCVSVCATGQSADDIGEELAQRLSRLSQMAPDNADRLVFADDSISIPALHLGPLSDLFNTTAVVVVPMRFGDMALTVMVGAWPESTSSSDLARNAETFQRLVNLATPALQRLRRIEHLEQRLSESETIRRLTDSIARTPRFRDALEVICRTSQLITGVDVVVAAETTRDHIIWHAASGVNDTSFIGTRAPIPASILDQIMGTGGDIVIEDVRNHPELSPEIVPLHTREGLRSTIAIPIYVHARLRGLLMFSTRRVRRFGSDEMDMIQALAGTMGTAVAASDARVSVADDA